jgi:hypothetical protein
MSESRDIKNMKLVIALLNSIPNVFWSLLNLLPASVFCYRYIDLKLLSLLMTISFLPVLIPDSLLNKMQVSKSRLLYKKIGVEFISRFTQNGSMINKLIKHRYREYKIVNNTRASITRLLQQTYVFEKFHLILLILFMAFISFAMIHGHYWWALIFILNNIIYNVYPCLLQQYIRLRLSAYKIKTI